MHMKKVTQKVFTLHSWFGLLAGAFMILIGITGSLLVFSDELDEWIYKEFAVVVPSGEPKSFDALIGELRAQYPDAKVLRLTKSHSPDRAYTAILQIGKERLYTYQNQYTGEVTGKIEVHSRLTNWLLRLHFTLLARPFGDAIVAIVGALFIGLSLTGLWIQRKSLVSVYTKAIRWKAGAKVASHDLHLLTGSASVAFCIVMAVSGFYMMLYTLDIEWWQKQLAARKTADEKRVEAKPSAFTLSADSLLNVSKNLIAEFEPKSLILPQNDKAPIRVLGYAKSSNPFYSEFNSYVNFKQDGSVIKVHDIRQASLSEKADMILKQLHFGQFGGIWIKIIYALGGFTPAILSITGFVLWWKRRRRKEVPKQVVRKINRPVAVPLPKVVVMRANKSN
jgi:uncharacterized iron-regulated membrane protein